MAKYQKNAEKLLHDIGGKKNIAAVSHCGDSRACFVLNDPGKADEKAIEDIPSVKRDVHECRTVPSHHRKRCFYFYNDFVTAVSGVEKGVSKEQGKQLQEQKAFIPFQRAIAVLAEIFTPLIPAIIVGGLILGIQKYT